MPMGDVTETLYLTAFSVAFQLSTPLVLSYLSPVGASGAPISTVSVMILCPIPSSVPSFEYAVTVTCESPACNISVVFVSVTSCVLVGSPFRATDTVYFSAFSTAPQLKSPLVSSYCNVIATGSALGCSGLLLSAQPTTVMASAAVSNTTNKLTENLFIFIILYPFVF